MNTPENLQTPVDELLEAFELFDDWEGRYQHIMELGEGLDPMPPELKSPATKVNGCESQVWMYATLLDTGRLKFFATSDGRIVRGLIRILLMVYDNKTPAEIRSVDIDALFGKLGLNKFLTPNRRSGFYAMTQRVHALADLRDGGPA